MGSCWKVCQDGEKLWNQSCPFQCFSQFSRIHIHRTFGNHWCFKHFYQKCLTRLELFHRQRAEKVGGAQSNQILQAKWCKITIANMEEAEIIRKIEQVQHSEFLKHESMINSEKIFIWKGTPSLKDWKYSDSYRLQELCRKAMSKGAGRDHLF